MSPGAVPDNATAESHKLERAMFKTCALGVLYGLSAKGMANKLNLPSEAGRQLLAHHKACYPDFWQWSQDSVSSALLRQEMVTRMGWHLAVPPRVDNEN